MNNGDKEISLTREERLEQDYGIHVGRRTEYPSRTRKDSNHDQNQEGVQGSDRDTSESGLEEKAKPKTELRHVEDLETPELARLAKEFLPTHYAIINGRKNLDYSSTRRFLKRTRKEYSLVVPMKGLSKGKAKRLIKSIGYKIIAELEEKDPETLEDLKGEHNYGHFR